MDDKSNKDGAEVEQEHVHSDEHTPTRGPVYRPSSFETSVNVGPAKGMR